MTDIVKIIESRASWREYKDQYLTELKEALQIAEKQRDYETVEEIKQMIDQRKEQLREES